jgi:hypothetical protein
MAKDDAFLPDSILAHGPPPPREGTTLRDGDPHHHVSLLIMLHVHRELAPEEIRVDIRNFTRGRPGNRSEVIADPYGAEIAPPQVKPEPVVQA